MLGLVLKGSGIATLASAGLLGGNYFYNRKRWKEGHPLLQEALELLAKDPRVIEEMGLPLEKTSSSISGVLEPNKSWANISFEVTGPNGSAKVSLLADAKSKDSKGDDYLLEGSAPEYSLIEQWLHALLYKDAQPEEKFWKLVSLHVRFDDITSYPVIAEGIRSHKELKEAPVASALPETSSEPKSEEEVTSKKYKMSERQVQIMKNARRRWLIMAVSIGFTLCAALIVRKFMRKRPVANSVFFNRVMDTLNTDPYTRSKLGTPISHLQNVKGNLNYNFTKGSLETIVYGTQGFGKVRAEGSYDSKEKRWHILKLELDTNDKTQTII